MALALAAIAAGCGGGGESSVAAAPEQCLESWNDEVASQRFGEHVYETHESHRAQVALLEPVEATPNVAPGGACAVIFAVPDSDPEYGTVGLVLTKLGWASMQELARTDQEALEAIQADASDAVNATLFPDGKLEPN